MTKEKFNWNKTAAIVGIVAGAVFLLQAVKGKGEGGESGGGGGLNIPFIPDFSSPSALSPNPVSSPLSSSPSILYGGFLSELSLVDNSYRDLGSGYYAGLRVLPSGEKKVVSGNTSSVGYAIDQITGQKYTDLGGGVQLYTEASRDMTPYEKISAKRGVNYLNGFGTLSSSSNIVSKKADSIKAPPPGRVTDQWGTIIRG